MTNCNDKHEAVRPHCFIHTEACSCRLELAYFAGKISKNRLVCKNAVVMAYYGSCRGPSNGLLQWSIIVHGRFAIIEHHFERGFRYETVVQKCLK